MSVNRVIYGLVLCFVLYMQGKLANYAERFLPGNFTIMLEGAILALIYGQLMLKGVKARFFSLENILLLAFILLTWVSLYFHGNFSFYSQEFRQLFVMLFVYFSIVAIVNDLRQVKTVLVVGWILAVSARFLLSIYDYGMEFITGFGSISRIGGNEDALIYVMSLPVCLYFVRYPHMLGRNSFKVLCLLLLSGVFLSFSRGAVVALAVTALFYAFRRKKGKIITVWKAVPVILLILALLPLGFWERMHLFVTDRTGTGRASAYQTAFNVIKEKPFTGIGAGNFRRDYFFYASSFDDFSKFDSQGETFAGGFFNDFLDIAAQIGIPALILYLIFIWRNWKNLAYVRKHKASSQDMFMLAEVLQYTFIAYLVGSQFAHSIYLQLPVFFAISISLKRILAEKEFKDELLAARG